MKIFLLAIASALLAACSSAPTTSAPVEDGKNKGISTVQANAIGADGLPLALTSADSVLSERSIYFDLDRYEVRDEYRTLLGEHAKFLKQNPQYLMLIQGNTDERGSSEYNLSLGQKRANAVRRVLNLLGVAESQLEAVSLGKEKPRALGHDETAWAENRRADLLYRAPDGRGEF